MASWPEPEFETAIWLELFRLADARLTAPSKVTAIGGVALILGYSTKDKTRDLDTATSLSREVAVALREAGLEVQARHALPIPPPCGPVAVWDAPYHYEDRLRRILPELKMLHFFAPEEHDLAMMKISRCEERDMEDLKALHAVHPLSLDTLLDRYQEMQIALDPRRFRWNFVDAVSGLFGDDVARVIDRALTTSGKEPGQAWPQQMREDVGRTLDRLSRGHGPSL